MLFQKAELLCTYSAQSYYQAIDILNANHIPYNSKVVSQHSSSFGSTRGHTGTLGTNMDYQYLYYIYVHKKNLEKAEYFIRKVRK